MRLMLCACADRLTKHQFIENGNNGVTGFLCKNCDTLKPLNHDGSLDILKIYNVMKKKKER